MISEFSINSGESDTSVVLKLIFTTFYCLFGECFGPFIDHLN